MMLFEDIIKGVHSWCITQSHKWFTPGDKTKQKNMQYKVSNKQSSQPEKAILSLPMTRVLMKLCI